MKTTNANSLLSVIGVDIEGRRGRRWRGHRERDKEEKKKVGEMGKGLQGRWQSEVCSEAVLVVLLDDDKRMRMGETTI